MNSGTQTRVLTAAILIPVIIAAIWWSPTWLIAGIAAVVAIVALREFFALGKHLGFRAYTFWTSLIGLGIFAQQWFASRAAGISRLGDLLYQARAPRISAELVLMIFLLGVAAIALGGRRPLAEVMSSVSISAAALCPSQAPKWISRRRSSMMSFAPVASAIACAV